MSPQLEVADKGAWRRGIGAATGRSVALFEDHDVLHGQRFQRPQMHEPHYTHFLIKLLHGHLMHFLDRDAWIFFAILDKDHTSAWLHRLSHFGQYFNWIGELVIDIHH